MAHLYGHLIKDGKTGDFHPLECTENPDGTFTLKVDTELVLDGASVNITNIKVGSTDQTAGNITYLKTDADGIVETSSTRIKVGSTDGTEPNTVYLKTEADGTVVVNVALGVPKHYNADADIAAAAVNFAATTKSVLIINSHATNDLFVSFDAGSNTHTIPAGESLSLDTAIDSLEISASADTTPYQILTTE